MSSGRLRSSTFALAALASFSFTLSAWKRDVIFLTSVDSHTYDCLVDRCAIHYHLRLIETLGFPTFTPHYVALAAAFLVLTGAVAYVLRRADAFLWSRCAAACFVVLGVLVVMILASVSMGGLENVLGEGKRVDQTFVATDFAGVPGPTMLHQQVGPAVVAFVALLVATVMIGILGESERPSNGGPWLRSLLRGTLASAGFYLPMLLISGIYALTLTVTWVDHIAAEGASPPPPVDISWVQHGSPQGWAPAILHMVAYATFWMALTVRWSATRSYWAATGLVAAAGLIIVGPIRQTTTIPTVVEESSSQYLIQGDIVVEAILPPYFRAIAAVALLAAAWRLTNAGTKRHETDRASPVGSANQLRERAKSR